MSEDNSFTPGDVVSGLEDSELVEIQRVAPFGGKTLVEGVGLQSRRMVRRPLAAEELATLVKVRGQQHTFDGDARLFLLGAEAERIRIAHQFDPLFAVNSSIVDPLPHQVEAVYRYLLPLPRIRFLLADDTGAGKTIMTGLLIKELLFRGVLQKVLIITPGGLTKQWKEEELQEKFGLYARLVNRASFDAEPGQFSRYEEGIFVTSIDFLARNDGCLKAASETQWDLVVVDEDRHTKTVGYDLTPEEKTLYDEVTSYVRSKRKEAKAKRNRNVELTLMVMQRRLASSLYAITRTLENRLRALDEVLAILRDPSRSETEKKRLFRGTPDPSDPRDITEYEDLTEEERERIDQRIFRQVLTDDPDKVEEERDEVERLFRLADSLKHHKEAKFVELLAVLDSSDVIRAEDDLPAAQGHAAQAGKLLIFTEHRDTLNSLARRLEEKGYTVATIHGGMDVDSRKQAQRQFRTRAKIMVATDLPAPRARQAGAAGEGINLQFCRYLINWDIPWNPNRLEQRMGRIHRYGQADDVWVYNLVAQNTREGSVLQKVLSKLDVMREQMGSDRVYDVIDEWLEDVPLVRLIESAIDIEDESASVRETDAALATASNERAARLMALQKKTSLASRLDLRSARELRDASDERRLQPLFIQRFFERAWTTCGGTVRKDLPAPQANASRQAGDHFPVWHIGSTPTALLELARERRQPLSENYETPFVFDKQLVSVASKVRVPEHTKLMGPGHPLFDTLIEWAIREARQAFAKGATLVDPNIAKPQRVWLVRSTIEDGRRQWRQDRRKPPAHERLAVVVQDLPAPGEARQAGHMGLRTTSPSYLLNCIAPDLPAEASAQAGAAVPVPDLPAPQSEAARQAGVPSRSTEEIQAWAYEQITERQLDQVKAVRSEECGLRRKYLNTAFTDLILELQEELNDLHQAQLYGDDNAEERERLRQRVEELKTRKAERLKELELMMKLTANLPDLLTEAVIAPVPVATVESDEEAPSKGVPMRRDDEVEAIAMDVAMRYERGRGWTPTDVSRDGEHYDVRSEGPGGEKRFIEVKGRAQSGAIVLTGPEVDKLRQLGERAWLYVVTFCKPGLSGVEGGERPRLRIIQDPISRLNPEMLYRQIQYLVEEGDWAQQGEEVIELGGKG